ncbi:MAG: type II toxin-antitoxin system VapB family antitoxin [Acidobacteria bacterium]|nr:type II toxin-antitoxin system VapB family antitoxin [Acidobacteriota bacterium]
MPISIKHEETEAPARRLAALTGESLTTVIRVALAERYARIQRGKQGRGTLADELIAIGNRCANRPIISTLQDEEILGYDEIGAPTR